MSICWFIINSSYYGFKIWSISLSTNFITAKVFVIFWITIVITIKSNIRVYETAFDRFIGFDIEEDFVIKLFSNEDFRKFCVIELSFWKGNEKYSRSNWSNFSCFRDFYFEAICCFISIFIFYFYCYRIASAFWILNFKSLV